MAAIAEGEDVAGVIAGVEQIVNEAIDMPVAWNGLSLSAAGHVAGAEMRQRHPWLSAEALDALQWAFAFAFAFAFAWRRARRCANRRGFAVPHGESSPSDAYPETGYTLSVRVVLG